MDFCRFRSNVVEPPLLQHVQIKKCFLLKEFLKKFGPEWYLSFVHKQPIERIREYFGEGVGIYFSFVEYYTVAMIGPAILGIFQYFLAGSYVPFFCGFYIIWLTVINYSHLT